MRARLIAVSAAFGLLSSAALAADLPNTKGAPAFAPPPPVLSWTGFYIGASAGYGWTGDNVTTSATPVFCNPLAAGCPTLGPATAAAVPRSFNTSPSGFIGGGQLGYNYQVGRFVWGVETDFSGADIDGSNTRSMTEPIPGFPADSVSVSGTADQRLEYLGTMRGRLGFTPINPVLIYATGGFAYGLVASSTTLAETLSGACAGCVTYPTTNSFSGMRAGWTIGGGLEWKFAPNWSVKAEYLYYDLGSASYGGSLVSTTVGLPFTTVGVSSRANFNGNIVRVGLNYQFNLFGPPAVAYNH